MFEELRGAIGPFYLYIKALHVIAAAIWGFSTAVAWTYYLKPALRSARAHPDDPVRIARRDDLMDRFDRGAAFEHVAFVVLVVTALAMIWISRVDLTTWSYVTAKLWIGVVVIVPMEALDVYLAHLGGNKARLRAAGDHARHERMMALHWRFLRVTEAIVVILVPAMFVIAVAKPF